MAHKVIVASAPVWSTASDGTKRGDYKYGDILEIGNQEYGRGEVLKVISPITRMYIKGWVAMYQLTSVVVPAPTPTPDPAPLPSKYIFLVDGDFTEKYIPE